MQVQHSYNSHQPMVGFYLLTFSRFPLPEERTKILLDKNRTHDFRTFFLFSSLISLIIIADGPHHYHHPSCGHEGRIFSSLPRFTPYDFLSRCKFSTLTTLINQWLDFVYSRSHAFRYRKKEQKSCLTRIELTTSALAGVQGTY